jgi:uncharacterized protein (TIGR00725 family)
MSQISVFGSSQPLPGQPEYIAAQRLGQLLAQAGHTVITGGYIGTMEAVSHGAAEAGGHVIGVTCAEIEAWRPVKANQWVLEERHFPTLRARLFELIDSCDAAIALPGGPGTLTEISLFWNQLLIGAIPARPLILVGAGWKAVLDCFFEQHAANIPPAQRTWLSFAGDVDSAVAQLQRALDA